MKALREPLLAQAPTLVIPSSRSTPALRSAPPDKTSPKSPTASSLARLSGEIYGVYEDNRITKNENLDALV